MFGNLLETVIFQCVWWSWRDDVGKSVVQRISRKNQKYFSRHWRSPPPSFLTSVDIWRLVRQHMRPEKLKCDKDWHLLTCDLCERQEVGGTRVGTAQCCLDLKRADPRNTTNEINCSVKSGDFIHFLGMIEERKRWRGQNTCNTCRIEDNVIARPVHFDLYHWAFLYTKTANWVARQEGTLTPGCCRTLSFWMSLL